jgi:hypothetical protein
MRVGSWTGKLDDVADMLFDLSFSYPDNFRQLPRRQRRSHQQLKRSPFQPFNAPDRLRGPFKSFKISN